MPDTSQPNGTLSDVLMRVLLNEFSEAEVLSLSEELGLSHRVFKGETARAKTRSFIGTVEKRKQMPRLVARVRVYRPEAYVAYGVDAAYRAVREAPRPPAGRRTGYGAVAVGAATALILAFALRPLAQYSPPGDTIGAEVPVPSATILDGGLADLPQPSGMASDGLAVIGVAAVQPTPRPVAPQSPGVVVLPQSLRQSSTPSARATARTSDSPEVIVESLNQQLLAYFNGQLKVLPTVAKTIAGGAPVARQPEAMSPAQAGAKNSVASVRYLRKPAVTNAASGQVTVATREIWRFGNVGGATKCETRDVRYTLTRQNGAMAVKDIQSRVVSPRCAPVAASAAK